jgi:hypothetical protein
VKTQLMFVAAAAAAAGILMAPTASADTDVVYIGGTGTGTGLPVLGTGGDGKAFADALVPGFDDLHNVVYNGSPVANPHWAVPDALKAVQGTDDPATVIGLSKGAQVAHGVEARDTNPNTQYILIGDPDDDHGISRTFGLSPKPREFTHNVNIVVGEYDGVGDMPDRPNALAALNAIAGWAVVHPNYGSGTASDPLTRLDDATVTTSKNPNGTTKTRTLIPTKNLPLTQGLREIERHITGGTWNTDQLDKALRPHIDAGYSRNDKPKDGNKVSPTTKASDTSKKTDAHDVNAGKDDAGPADSTNSKEQ